MKLAPGTILMTCVISAMIPTSIFAPVVIWSLIHRAAVPEDLPALFQLNAAFWGCALAAIAAWWIRKASRVSTESMIAAMAFSAVAAWYLAMVHACSGAPSSDYMLVQAAAGRLLCGQTPYFWGSGYSLYPPLYAQVLAQSYCAVVVAGGYLHWHPSATMVLNLLFYLFQNLQFLSVVALAYFAYVFVAQTGVSRLNAALLVCGVMALNYPIQATIGWTQVNNIVAALVLCSCLFPNRLNVLRGFSLALAAHLKVYPLLLLPAWVFSGQRKALLWALIWILLIALVTCLPFGISLWREYLDSVQLHLANSITLFKEHMIEGPNLQSLAYSTWHLLAAMHLVRTEPAPVPLHYAVQACEVAIAAWFMRRVGGRVYRARRAGKAAGAVNQTVPAQGVPNIQSRSFFYDNVCDLLSLGLLMGPCALNHHYVLAVPIILWTLVRSGKEHPLAALLGSMFVLNFQSVGYHSSAATWMQLQPLGLLLLAWARD